MHDCRLEVRAEILRHRLNHIEISEEMGIPLKDLLTMLRLPLNEADAKKITDAIDRIVERES